MRRSAGDKVREFAKDARRSRARALRTASRRATFASRSASFFARFAFFARLAIAPRFFGVFDFFGRRHRARRAPRCRESEDWISVDTARATKN